MGHWAKECTKGLDPEWLKTQHCFHCQEVGHFVSDCPYKGKDTNNSFEKLISLKAVPFKIPRDDTFDPITAPWQAYKQGTKEWLDQGKMLDVNGSAAAAILGWYVKKDQYERWLEKKNKDSEKN